MVTIKLNNGYFIEKNINNVMLKQSYMGIRKGEPVVCSKIISHHSDINDAVKAYVARTQNIDEDREFTLPEYVEEIKRSNERAVENITAYLNSVEETNRPRDEDEGIVTLIPFGKENAISRDDLTRQCVDAGLIDEGVSQDRAMRRLLAKARFDYAILNDQDGGGYYRPTKNDYDELRKHLAREQKRARTLFASLKVESALLEDFRTGRI